MRRADRCARRGKTVHACELRMVVFDVERSNFNTNFRFAQAAKQPLFNAVIQDSNKSGERILPLTYVSLYPAGAL